MDELEMKQNEEQAVETATNEVPLDKNLRLMSPTMMVVRRFFRSKLSIVGMVMVIALFLFSFVGPLFLSEIPTTETVGGVEIEVFTPNNGKWGEIELDASGKVTVGVPVPIRYKDDATGIEYTVYQTLETEFQYNSLAAPSKDHLLGTDDQGYDVFVRLMYGGRISLIVSFLSVFLVTIFGVILGGIAGYYGGAVDTAIMRLCDVLMCLPGIPIMLIISTALDSPQYGIPAEYRIYLLMAFLSLISWPGGARLVRGQILSLREQEFMVAAEAMGYSTSRKIFKHLIPNVMPQLIVSMTLSLGSMILYEATLSYLNMGVKAPYAAWGTMINIISTNQDILQNYPNVWVPAGICIVIAVLGFNFVGDGLRDALDPKARR
jgi:peptide/nickel transport system permease protein